MTWTIYKRRGTWDDVIEGPDTHGVLVVELNAVIAWLRHVDRLDEIPAAKHGMPDRNPLWDAANALDVAFGSVDGDSA